MLKTYCSNIAVKYNNIEKEVNVIMGGRVLDYEGRSIFYGGLAEGYAEGRMEGHAEGLAEGKLKEKFDTAKRLRNAGMTDKQIHQFTNLPLNDIRNL